MISVRGLTKLYGTFPAVRSISFDVGVGEVLGLVGPNGAGKTTTLRCLAGIIAPSQGTVSIAGHDIQRDGIEAKRALAFIPDEPHLFDYLTVEEHLRFIARLYGVADVEARIPVLLAELELTEKCSGRCPGELSRGMRQKLAIACGLIHSPSVLILDEPLATRLLDPGGHASHARDDRCACDGGRRRHSEFAPAQPGRGTLHEAAGRSTRGVRGVRHDRRDHRRRIRTSLGSLLEDMFLALTGRSRLVAMNAFIFLVWSSWRNRVRLERLRTSRAARWYAAALIVGSTLYLWGFLLRPSTSGAVTSVFLGPPTETLLTLLLVVTLMGSWVFGSDTTALAFTQAEVSFLFPGTALRVAH